MAKNKNKKHHHKKQIPDPSQIIILEPVIHGHPLASDEEIEKWLLGQMDSLMKIQDQPAESAQQTAVPASKGQNLASTVHISQDAKTPAHASQPKNVPARNSHSKNHKASKPGYSSSKKEDSVHFDQGKKVQAQKNKVQMQQNKEKPDLRPIDKLLGKVDSHYQRGNSHAQKDALSRLLQAVDSHYGPARSAAGSVHTNGINQDSQSPVFFHQQASGSPEKKIQNDSRESSFHNEKSMKDTRSNKDARTSPSVISEPSESFQPKPGYLLSWPNASESMESLPINNFHEESLPEPFAGNFEQEETVCFNSEDPYELIEDPELGMPVGGDDPEAIQTLLADEDPLAAAENQYSLLQTLQSANVEPLNFKKKIQFTPSQQRAFNTIMEGSNVFLSGEAGTGKSFVIQEVIKEFRRQKRRFAITASTGIAAIHIHGQTAHSFFHVPPTIPEAKFANPHKIPEELTLVDTIIIDEISMIRIDVFEYIARLIKRENTERFKRNPNSTLIQVIAVGDFFQIPPVVSNEDAPAFKHFYPRVNASEAFAFLSPAWKWMKFQPCFLTEVVRQDDKTLLNRLNRIRKGDASALRYFNRGAFQQKDPNKAYIRLCGRTSTANEYNQSHLNRLPGKVSTYEGSITGSFPKSAAPVPVHLDLKIGARVIITRNDKNRKYANGSMGIVVSLPKEYKPMADPEDMQVPDMPDQTRSNPENSANQSFPDAPAGLVDLTEIPASRAGSLNASSAKNPDQQASLFQIPADNSPSKQLGLAGNPTGKQPGNAGDLLKQIHPGADDPSSMEQPVPGANTRLVRVEKEKPAASANSLALSAGVVRNIPPISMIDGFDPAKYEDKPASPSRVRKPSMWADSPYDKGQGFEPDGFITRPVYADYDEEEIDDYDEAEEAGYWQDDFDADIAFDAMEEPSTPPIGVRLTNGEIVEVCCARWQSIEYQKNEKGELEPFVVGEFEQYPLRLAWAITIHKSQGQTFENVELVPEIWSPGQLYVALSRLKSIDGLVLTDLLDPSLLVTSEKAKTFYKLAQVEAERALEEVEPEVVEPFEKSSSNQGKTGMITTRSSFAVVDHAKTDYSKPGQKTAFELEALESDTSEADNPPLNSQSLPAKTPSNAHAASMPVLSTPAVDTSEVQIRTVPLPVPLRSEGLESKSPTKSDSGCLSGSCSCLVMPDNALEIFEHSFLASQPEVMPSTASESELYAVQPALSDSPRKDRNTSRQKDGNASRKQDTDPSSIEDSNASRNKDKDEFGSDDKAASWIFAARKGRSDSFQSDPSFSDSK